MRSPSVKVSSRYRISIPAWAHKQLKILTGDRLLVEVQDGMMILLPLHQSYARSLAGLHQEIWGNSDDYVIRERSAWIDDTK